MKIREIAREAESKNDFINFNPQFDSIFVLAGGIKDDGEVHEWVVRRLDLALNIYFNYKNKNNDDNIKIICLGGGTYHKSPILNDDNYVIHESTACAEYLINKGINPKNIYKEWASYDTIANGYFAFANFINPMQLKNILVITSNFHMERAKAIFNWMKFINDSDVKINYVIASDEGLDEYIIKTRTKREMKSLENINNKLIPNIKSMKQFHSWFYEDHKAYCSESDRIKQDDTSSAEKKSY